MESGDTEWINRLAESVVEQVLPLVPSGVQLHFETQTGSAKVRLVADGREAVFDFGLIADQPNHGTRIDNSRTALVSFLSMLQDFVILHTKEPWPRSDANLPLPTATVADGRIDAWYGDTVAPGTAVISVDVR